MEKDLTTVLELIDRIKKVHDDKYVKITGDYSDVVFQYHHCFYFADMLNKFYEDGEYYMRKDGGHVVYRIGDFLYDSIGVVLEKDNYAPFEAEDWLAVETFMIPNNPLEREKLNYTFNSIVEEVKGTYYPEMLQKVGYSK